MGNLIYPSLPGLALPQGRAVLPPKVHVRTTPSQREFRSRDALLPRYQYSLAYEFLRAGRRGSELDSLVGFFNRVGGAFDSWLYLDPDDPAMVGQPFGSGDGVTSQFVLTRSFGGFAEPVDAAVGVPLIFWNGQPANLLMNTGFELRPAGGPPYGYYQYNNAGIAISYVAPAGRTGGVAYGLKALGSSTSTFGLLGGQGPNDGAGVVGGVRGGWQPSTQYTLSWYAKKVGGAGWAGMALAWNQQPATFTALTNPALTVAWQRYVMTFTTGATVEPGFFGTGFFIFADGATAAGDEIHIDDIQLTLGGAAQTYAGDQSYVVNGGVVAFDAAPPAGTVLIWSGRSYRRCRFLGDRLDTEKFLADLFAAKKVEFISVKG